ncbi:MAG: DUF4393 domain-containing protein [Planctomycetes bacterium]|uniref:Abi-alpha family protein n=1 Tax=Candidatus Wunengus sp. YC65 TaxID=3367701 RepID=UPI001DAFE801|nr:DUF4393 domain-containing protein [Planctomycetota bacterium]MBI5796092.1 DUF4393 domain-containing protein [Planctomycetota bacterium]
MEEESRAIREVAKTAGKGIDAVREFGSFISQFIKGPIEQGMGIFEDKLKYMRWERQIRLMQRVNELLNERNLREPSRAVPMKIAIPLFQSGSLEEDDLLQDIWAKLLVNAADANFGKEIMRSYITILENITSFEAVILEKIYLVSEQTSIRGIGTAFLPERVELNVPQHGQIVPDYKVQLALSNLIRLGCITPTTSMGGEILSSVYQTALGRAFVEACSLNKINNEFFRK